MNKILLTAFAILLFKLSYSQQSYIDSLKKQVNAERNDTMLLLQYGDLNETYDELNPDSSMLYAEKELTIAKKLNLKLEEVHALGGLGYAQMNKGNYPRALQSFLSGITIAEDKNSEKNLLPPRFPPTEEFLERTWDPSLQRLEKLGRIHQYIGILYGNANNYDKAISHYLLAKEFAEKINNVQLMAVVNLTLGRTYYTINKTDSALIILQQAYSDAKQSGYKKYFGSILLNLGRVYAGKGNSQLAKEYFRAAIISSAEQHYYRGVVASNLALSDLYKNSGREDSSLLYAENALPVAQFLNAPDLLQRTYTALADYYKTRSINDSAVKYQSFIIKINDSLFNSKQAQEFQNIDFDEQQKQQQIEAAKAEYRNEFRMYLLLAGLAIFLFIAIILWRSSLQRKKANTLLFHQKKELESALKILKSTQAQLIQSEKMASLGELTAGIAHEIQNPLNFVNNFSEVNNELIEELKAEGSELKDEEKEILDDIYENNEKISFHGKRADAIVKNMLQHSRKSSGQKEPTDINALCDEYLRLSYHGMRGKEKSFNTEIKTDFDENIGNINVIRQDIGRVLLNLFNNAFYAVNEKKKTSGENYKPCVSVQTKSVAPLQGMGAKIEIIVNDNGNGIPQNIVDKIFQPFFTTKPTGEGTGLGLSLSYDIIKTHGGEIKVETKVDEGNPDNFGKGEGTTFIVQLPN